MQIEIPRQAGQVVRRIRNDKGWTQKQLAQAAGVSERLIVSLELGDATGIRLDKLLQILSALELSLSIVGRETCLDNPDMSNTREANASSSGESALSDEAKKAKYTEAFSLLTSSFH